MRRRTFLALAGTRLPWALNATSARPPRDLCWADLPVKARRFSIGLGLTGDSWSSWIEGQRISLVKRIAEGSAEHVAYFLTHAQSFRALSPALRAQRFQIPSSPRHSAVLKLYRGIEAEWSIDRCLEHAAAFQSANRDPAARDRLYQQRGLSSDSSAQANPLLSKLPAGNPTRILLAGPGLDLTRREPFDDSAPLVSHQYVALRQRFPQAAITCVDVRPEVLDALQATRLDVTTQILSDAKFDLIVATNLLLYFEDRELLTALAGFATMLSPSGLLLHNDMRFAAKVFGEALSMPVERYDAVPWDSRRWDRAVIHRKASSS